MTTTTSVIYYPRIPGMFASVGELILDGDVLTLMTEGIALNPLAVGEFNNMEFQIPVKEIAGYSHWQRSSYLFLYINKRRYPLDFAGNTSVTKSLWNQFKGDRSSDTGVYEWVETMEAYGIKKRINYKGFATRVLAIALVIVGVLISKFLQN